MRIELSQARFDEGVGDLDIGHILFDTQAQRQVKIVKFSGYTEIDDATGVEHETINVHFGGVGDSDMSGLIDFETLQRGIYRDRTFQPIAPVWFVEEVKSELDTNAEAEVSEALREKATADEKRKILSDIKAKAERRDVEDWSDTELFAKVSGAPLAIAEEMLVNYENNLARMANSTPKQLQLIGKLTEKRSEKIAAAFELGKRLARFHAEKDKITSPSDVADLMMSKMRYLQKEIVVVLALDTKGSVTSKGTLGDASELTWGRMLNEATIFEGTLNASVFHPREIFRFAIEECANSIVLCHNHPSGDPQPSQEDIRATKQLIEAGNQIGIKILDHIVIGDGIFVSLKEEGFI